MSPKSSRSQSSSGPLYAIGALAKKAKQAALKEYATKGIEDDVMEVYKTMKQAMETVDLSTPQTPGPLQTALTKRKGTITVIAEYKRKMSEAENGFINELYDPELLSPTFREAGASAVAVMADPRMGGCDYTDIAAFCEEQRRAKSLVPGPIPVINNDLVVDELQIAQSVASNCQACVIYFNVVGASDCASLLKAAHAVDLEAIVAVSNPDEAQQAVDMGARILKVVQGTMDGGVEEKTQVLDQLVVPEGQEVCLIAYVAAKNNKQLQEVEEAWMLRDKGFNAVWVGEALYKSGVDATEHPGAIIKAMKSKSSVKWASPKGAFGSSCVLPFLVMLQQHCQTRAHTLSHSSLVLFSFVPCHAARSGRGEGAREYLGDILM